jgi:hypothetical protein
MFVSPEAPARLRRVHRERFFEHVVEPMVAEARAIGIPVRDVIARIEQLAEGDVR